MEIHIEIYSGWVALAWAVGAVAFAFAVTLRKK